MAKWRKGSRTGGGQGTTTPWHGNTILNGSSIVRQDETDNKLAETKRKSSGAATGIHSMVSDSNQRKRRGFHTRFDIGEPVEEKVDWLDTEIGRVNFTEDLVLGFNDEPAATTKKEAWDIVIEAADRYARLVAFVAAEQGFDCEGLNARVDRFGHQTKMPHPVTIKELIGIIREEGEDPVLDKVVAAFERNRTEDEELLLRAAEGYARYMENTDLSEKYAGYTEHNLEAAIGILSQLSGRGGTFTDDSYPLNPPEAHVGADKLTAAAMLKDTLDPDALEALRTNYERSPDTPLVEEFNGGLRINVTDTESLEIVAGEYGGNLGGLYWNSGVRRVTTKSGERVVTASGAWRGTFSNKEELLCAANFTRPLAVGWEPGGRIGFRNRTTQNGIQ
jgi:hypothetical protein